jgi:CMP/dCMP kinase
MTVITVSRQYGSGGDEIAIRLCEMLGYARFDKSLITQAATAAGISTEDVYDFSEDSHKVRSFLDRLFDRPAMAAAGRMWEGAGGMEYLQSLPLSDDNMLTLVQKAILSAYETGDFVIVGRGSQVLLKDKPNVFHIRVVAPVEERIQRIKDEMKQKRESYDAHVALRREAQDFLVERDAASDDYIKRYYNADWNDNQLYHLVLNTGKISIDQALDLIDLLIQGS